MGKILGIAVSKEWKSMADPILQCRLTKEGLEGDIHYGTRKSPVSLLPYEKVKEYFEQQQQPLRCGRFGENLLIQGVDWKHILPGDRFCTDEVVLEVTKIGAGGPKSDAYHGFKVCTPMEPYFVFCRVLRGGLLEEQEEIRHQ